MANSLLAPAAKVRKNCRVKIYPDGTIGEILVCSLACWVPPDWEAVDSPDEPHTVGTTSDDGGERARRRARRHVSDLIRSNPDLDVFWTLTLAPDACTERGTTIGRTDYKSVNRKVQQWLADRVRRRGLRYVAVYEYHERVEADGLQAIHVHGVANHSAMSLVDGGRKYKDKLGHWHKIYNVADWHLGITTAMYLYGDRGAATAYISKYIYKSERPVGGRWYMHSHNLSEPHYEYIDIDYMSAPGKAWLVPQAHCAYKSIPVDSISDIL